MSYLNELDEVTCLRNEFCAMIRHGGCPAMCKIKRWAELKNAVICEAFSKAGMQVPAEAIEPFGLMPVRQLIREIRRVYLEWDAGRISQSEFNAQAHRINKVYELWAKLDRLDDDEVMRYHDEYVSSIMAVNDVCEL